MTMPATTGPDFLAHLDQLGVPIWTEVVHAPGKMPTRPVGWQQLTPDNNQQRITQQPAGAAICANMGGPIAVVDVDTKNGAQVDKIRAALDGAGVRVYADILTPSGGRHFYVPGHPDLPTVHAKADRDGLTGYPGVEILSYGTNVFLPGSLRQKYRGAPYLILDDQLEVLADGGDDESAENLAAWVAAHRISQPEQFDIGDVWDGTPPDRRERAYLDAAVRRRVETIAAMGPESGRNTKCFEAGLMIGNYEAGAGLDAAQAVEQIVEAATRCGLVAEDGERAVRATIASGVRLGRTRPRQVPAADNLMMSGQQPGRLLAAVPDLPNTSTADQVPKEEATPQAAGQEPGEQDSEKLPPSWSPIVLDAILDGTWQAEQPTLMPRVDGHQLVYPGRVHSFHGESESGKSFVAQAEVARLLTDPDAGRILYIDYESDQGAVVGRLLALGAPPEQIRTRLDYIRPETSPYQLPAEREAFHQLLGRPYVLAVLDGVTEALVTYGAASLDNDEITAWIRLIPRLIAQKTGAAVTLIDHVVKSGESRGRFAIGGQAKLATLDGAAYSVEVIEPLGRGMRGIISLRIAKDRPGAVRPHAGAYRSSDRTQEAARVVIDSHGDGTIEASYETPDGAEAVEKKWRPTVLMERVSNTLQHAGQPLTQRQVTDATHGNAKNIRAALQVLIDEGHVTTSFGPNRAILHTLQKPFSELTDNPVRPVRPSASPVRPDAASDDVRSRASETHSSSVSAGRTHAPRQDQPKTDECVQTADSIDTDLPSDIADDDHSDCNRCGKRTHDKILDTYQGICFTCHSIEAGI